MSLTQEKAPEEKLSQHHKPKRENVNKFREHMGTHVTTEDAELQLDTTQNK